uniref:Secreted protein n=1 Tax=Anguilla anguilla TaxID=7936 RepID=A0A0E9RBF2_ANGAN
MSNTPLHIYAQFLLYLSCAYSVNTEQLKCTFFSRLPEVHIVARHLIVHKSAQNELTDSLSIYTLTFRDDTRFHRIIHSHKSILY